MSDKSNKYGYVGVDIPAQSFGSNKGVFNPAEINELVADNKWTTFGQLELIETQTYSSTVSFVDFTSIQESTYNVHFMTFSQMSGATDNTATINIRFYESGVLETASVYQWARQNAGLNPSVGFNQDKTTTASYISTLFGSGTATGENDSGYAYFYNLGDSSKYSFTTFQCVGLTNESYYMGAFGSGVLPQASTVDGIRILMNSGNYNDFKVSLYGIRYS
jgi:hypothetical protein